jgi:hypothetical protein
MPSLMASSPASSHASMQRDPPMAERMNGMVRNGPIPTMSIMFSATPRQRPMSRRSMCGQFNESSWRLAVGS